MTENDIQALTNELQNLKNDLQDLARNHSASVTDFLKLSEYARNLSASMPPVGSVVGIPIGVELDTHWKYCDGTTIEDPESPLHGRSVPNISDNRYLIGVDKDHVGGSIGRNDWERDGAHRHKYSGETDRNPQRFNAQGDGKRAVQTAHGNALYKLVWSYNGTTDKEPSAHDHGEKRPLSIGVRFAMRIK